MANILIRTCWNTKNYQQPSGTSFIAEGVQTNYVKEEGFGMEEWNFNQDDLVDGFLYGYIRPDFNTLVRQVHNIWFYTISPDNRMFFIGEYRDAYFLTLEEREELEDQLKKLGILQRRIKEVYSALQKTPEFEHVTESEVSSHFIDRLVFRLKVSPSNAILYSEPKEFSIDTWDTFSADKKLNKRYKGYNHILNVEAFRKTFSI